METLVRPKIISIDQMLQWKKICRMKPIDGLHIENITIPAHLASKKRITEAPDTIAIHVRKFFNSVTEHNVASVQKQLIEIVISKAQNVASIIEIADEILKSFMVAGEQNIKNYIQLLNVIHSAQILVPDSPEGTSKTIGYYFLQKCRDTIFDKIGETNVSSLAKMDLDDPDQLDTYTREREKIINLIITICGLYDQRNTTFFKINRMPIFSVVKNLLDVYQKYHKKWKHLVTLTVTLTMHAKMKNAKMRSNMNYIGGYVLFMRNNYTLLC